jgi:ketosteroid isomerase-like protein
MPRTGLGPASRLGCGGMEAIDKEAIVRRMLDDYLRGDFERALSAFAEDVEWRDQFAIYHGREGVAQSVSKWAGTWDEFRMEVAEVLDAGGQDVLVILRQSGRGRGSGVPVEGDMGWMYSLRGREIVSVRLLADPDAALRAARSRAD